jgi:hypothetical protein
MNHQPTLISLIKNRPVSHAREILKKYNIFLRVAKINDHVITFSSAPKGTIDVVVKVPYEPMVEEEDGSQKWDPRIKSEKNGAIVVGIYTLERDE